MALENTVQSCIYQKKGTLESWLMAGIYAIRSALCYALTLVTLASCSPQVQREASKHLVHPTGIESPTDSSPDYNLQDPNSVLNLPGSEPAPALTPNKDFTWIGSVSSVFSYSKEDYPVGEFEGYPFLALSSLGYNILNRSRSEGTILFPNVTGVYGKDRDEYFWNNGSYVGFGAVFQKFPFTLKTEMVHKEPRSNEEPEDYFRAEASFWKDGHAKPIFDSETYPFTLWFISYLVGKWDGQRQVKGFVVDGRLSLGVDVLRIGNNPPREYTLPHALDFNGLTLAPSFDLVLNASNLDRAYYNFTQYSARVKAYEGPYEFFAEWGHRSPFHMDNFRGDNFRVGFQLWVPLDTGRR